MKRPLDEPTWRAELNSVAGSATSALALHSQQGDSRHYTVCRVALQQTVLSEISISTLCHLDGSIYPCPQGMEDDVLDLQFRNKRLIGVPVDALVERSLKLMISEGPAEARAQLTTMRARLLRALDAVEGAIGKVGTTTKARVPALQ